MGKATNSPITPPEFIEHINKWWLDRQQAYHDIAGWGGRDLRNQEQLIQTVLGIEDDVSQLLRYMTAVFKFLAEPPDSTQSEEQASK